MKGVTETAATRVARPEPELEPVKLANADTELTLVLLQEVYREFDRETYQASSADPSYATGERVVLKYDRYVVGHVQFVARKIRYGAADLTVGELHWPAIFHRFDTTDNWNKLLAYAEERAGARGLPLLIAAAGRRGQLRAELLQQAGWIPVGSARVSEALAGRLPSEPEPPGPAWIDVPEEKRLRVQPWRQDQLQSLRHLYERNCVRTAVTCTRSECYWEWLVNRSRNLQFWLAQRLDEPVGYAVVRAGNEIFEIACEPSDREAVSGLLARVRMEALDLAKTYARLWAPAMHPAHEWFAQAGPIRLRQAVEPRWWVKVLAPQQVLAEITPELAERVRQGGLAKKTELAIVAAGHPCTLRLDPHQVQVVAGKHCKRQMGATAEGFIRLLFGTEELKRLVADGYVDCEPRPAIKLVELLFPRRTFWLSPLDLPEFSLRPTSAQLIPAA